MGDAHDDESGNDRLLRSSTVEASAAVTMRADLATGRGSITLPFP
jgi:hypothetical protein